MSTFERRAYSGISGEPQQVSSAASQRACPRGRRLVSGLIGLAANRLGFADAYGFVRRGLLKSQVSILVYHRVGEPGRTSFSLAPVKPSDFEDQIRYLSHTFEVLSLDRLAWCLREKKALPNRAVAITFDDGYRDNYVYAYPVLRRYNVPATIFLATGHIGTGKLFWWDRIRYAIHKTSREVLDLDRLGTYRLGSTGDRLRAVVAIEEKAKRLWEDEKQSLIERLLRLTAVDVPEDLGRELILSWDEVREMDGNGVSFGAHTVTHPILTRVPPERARYEITRSKEDIEQRLGKPVTAFSYPNGHVGDYDIGLAQFVRESGFSCAVADVSAMIAPEADLYQLGRISPGRSFDLFKLHISGLYPDAAATVRRLRGGMLRHGTRMAGQNV